MKKQAWTVILLWMALFSFTLSAQEGGGTTTGLTVTKNSDPPENINGSCIINSSGTYHFTGTYNGTLTAEVGSSEETAVISVEAGIEGDVTIILEDVNITLNENQQCPLSARNATGTVIVQLKGTNTLASTYSGGGGQCPALWAPQTTEGELIIENLPETESEVGSLTATGGEYAAGIGGGNQCDGGTITIKGGTIEAKGGKYAAGIGGGRWGNGGTITITGGKVQATGGNKAAGIGGGDGGGVYGVAGGTIKITGGTVEATGSDGGAGIGGGYNGGGGTIKITGGTVLKAKGGDNAAGIGGGYGGAGGTIKITGGTVQEAKGVNGGAGIGGGFWGNGGTIILSGGTVTAKGGNWSAGIGGGYPRNGGTITITGGEVTATKGSNTATDTPDINGNTVIVGPDATVKKGIKNGTLEYNDYANGFVFKDNNATMKGTATLLADMTINAGQTLIIPEDASLTIEENVTLENKGTITNNGTIYKRGTITNIESVSNVEPGKIIIQTKLTEEMITVAPGTYTYDGNAATPSVAVRPYTMTTDYTVEYENNKDAGTATVKVTPTDKDHGTLYGETVTKEFTINKATPSAAHFKFTASSELTYDGQAKTATVVAEERFTGMGEITINYYNGGTLLSSAPADAGTYTVKISVTDGTNFIASSELITDNNWTFTIAKATPIPPTSLTATYGETLADVTLPAGWTWIEPTTTSVGDVGTNTFPAKYTPTDTDNYNVVENVQVSIKVVMEANLSFAQPTLTMTQGNAVPANELTNTHNCPVTYSSSNEAVATVVAETGAVTVVGVGTTTITATAQGNYTGSASYTLTVNSYIPPYTPPTPDPDPIYYTVTIPTEVAGAIIHGGGTHEVEEYTYCSFRIELDPNGNGEYPTVTKGYWWDTLTPDGQGNYSVYVTGNTQITIGEVPTNSYDYYQVTLPTDSVAEADDQYWSGDYIEVTGASPLRAAEEASLSYQAPFGTTVTLRPIETERRKFLQWEDGSKQKERTLTLRADQEVKALWQRISPTGIEAIAAGSVIRGERGQLYIEVPEACDVTLYTYGGVPVRVARLAAGANRLSNLNAGLYLVKIDGAQAVPVRIR